MPFVTSGGVCGEGVRGGGEGVRGVWRKMVAL